MIQATQLSFSYGKGSLIRDIHFRIDPGECLVLTGPNGSGKSTLLSLIAGALKPKSGQITVEGKIGLVPQGLALFEDMSVEDNLLFFAALNKVPLPETLPFGLQRYRRKKLSALSGGSQKRVSIACALLGDPPNLMLDEPCSGLDIAYREELTGLIADLKRQGRCLLYVAHEPAEYVSFYDKLLFLGEEEPLLFTAGDFAAETQAETVSRLTDTYRDLCLGKGKGEVLS